MEKDQIHAQAATIRLMLATVRAAHAAFTNSEPAGDASNARIINDDDYRDLTRALFMLDCHVAPDRDGSSMPHRLGVALRPLIDPAG